MPPKPLRRPTRKEAEALSQNVRFVYLSQASQLLASEGNLKDAAYFGLNALKVADAQGAAVARRIALQHCEVCGVFLSPSSCSSVECVDISSRSQRRPAATNANPAPGGPGNRSSGGKGASNVVAVVRTCQVCGHRNSQPFAAPHVARRIAESEARAIKQLRLRQQQQQAEGPQQIQEAPVPQRQEAQQTMEDLEREPRQQQPVDATTVEAAPPAIVETATLQPCCKPTADAIYVASVPPEDVESWGVGTDLVARASETRADAAIHADETVPVVEDTWAACLHAVAANGTNDDEFSATAERHETLALPSLPQPLMDGVRAIAAETDGSPADAEVASAQEAQNPEEGVTARMVVDNAQEAVAEDPAAVDCVKETGTTEDAAGVAALRDCAEVLVAVSSLAAETPCFEGQRVAEPQDVADGCSNQMADVAEESSPAAATGRASEAAPAKEQAEEQGSAGNAVHAAQAVQDEITAEDAEMHARKASEVGGSTTGAEGRSAAVPDDAVAPTASTVTRKPLEVRYPAVAAGGAAVDAVADDQELGLQAAPKLPSAMEQPYIVCAAVGSAVGEAPGGAVKMGTVASSIGEMAAGLLKAAMGQESFGVACVSTVPRATQLAEQEPAELTLVTTGGVEEGHPTPQVNVGRGDGGDERPPTANPGAEAAIWTSDEQAMEVDEGEEIADGREGEAGKSEEDNDWEGCVQEVSAEESWKTSKPVDSLEVILQRVPQKCVAAQSCTILHEEMLGRPGAASRGAVLISSKEEDGEERASNAKDQDEDFGEEEDAEAVGKAMGFVAAAAGAVTGPIIGTEMAALGMATGAAAMAAAGAAMCCIHDSESNKDEGPAPEAVAAVLLEVHVVEAAVAQKKPPSSLQERHVEEGGSEIPAVGNNTAALAASPQVTGEAANVALEAEGSAVTASMQMAVGVTEGEDAAESQKVEEDDAHGWGTPGITSGDVSHGINEGGNSEEERDPEEEKEEACGEMAMAAASVLQKADTVSPAQQSGLRWAAALHKPIATAEAAVATAAKAAAGDAATVACEAATARSLVKPQCMPSCEPEHLPVVLDRARPVQPAQPAVQSQDLLSKKHGERTQVQTQQQRQQRTRVLAVGAGNELADPEVMVGCAAVGRAANEMSVLSEGGMPSRLSEAPLKALRTRCQQSRRQKDQQIVQQPGALHTRSEPSHKRRRAQPDWLPGGYVSETSIHPLLPQEREDGVLVYEAPYAQGLLDLRPVVELEWPRALHQPHHRRRFLRERALYMAHYARFAAEPLQSQSKERPQLTGELRPGRYPMAIMAMPEREPASQPLADRSAADRDAAMGLDARQLPKERCGRRELIKDSRLMGESDENSDGIPGLGPWARLPPWEGISRNDEIMDDEANDGEEKEPRAGKTPGRSDGRMVTGQLLQKPQRSFSASPGVATPENAAEGKPEERRWEQNQLQQKEDRMQTPLQRSNKRDAWAAADGGNQQRKKHSRVKGLRI